MNFTYKFINVTFYNFLIIKKNLIEIHYQYNFYILTTIKNHFCGIFVIVIKMRLKVYF